MQDIEGLTISEVPEYADNNHWMNVLQIDSKAYSEDREALMQRLKKIGVQTRSVWALNHLQKPYQNCQNYKIERAQGLVQKSLCLPSSTNLTNKNINQVIDSLDAK